MILHDYLYKDHAFMINSLSVLAIITARKNSKRLPSKNTLNLCGKPLIEWTFKAASASKYLDYTLLSSDDNSLGELARQYSIDQPFIRPPKLATDEATTEETMFHSLQWLKEHHNKQFDLVVLLQPTSPFRTGQNIDQALEYFSANDEAQSLVSVTRVTHSQWLHTIDENEYLKQAPSDLFHNGAEHVVIPNGAIYIVKSPLFLENKQRYTSKTLAYIMDQEPTVDIDTEADFNLASKFCDVLEKI